MFRTLLGTVPESGRTKIRVWSIDVLEGREGKERSGKTGLEGRRRFRGGGRRNVWTYGGLHTGGFLLEEEMRPPLLLADGRA